MNPAFPQLKPHEQRGSKPRCHLLTHGTPMTVAARLTALVAPYAVIAPTDRWMPQGFDEIKEAELHKADRLLGDDHCDQVRDWWFAIFKGGRQKGPSFDIASTCTIEGRQGILLVEAKAYDNELLNEEGGKPLPKDSSDGQKLNHDHIGEVIKATNDPLSKATGCTWSLSHESRYQMSNRFASACKLAELGHPVILVYLGFLNAMEMSDQGTPFETPEKWEMLVKSHGEPLIPAAAWNREWRLHGQPFVPLIRSLEWPLIPMTNA